jgi:hypothetical protein
LRNSYSIHCCLPSARCGFTGSKLLHFLLFCRWLLSC